MVVGRNTQLLSSVLSGGHRLQRYGLYIAIVIFCIGLGFALIHTPRLIERVELKWWALIMPLVPMSIALNARQFRITGQLIYRDFSRLRALRIAIIGSAANLLPIPGGPAIRTAALRNQSNGYRDGFLVTFLAGALWAGLGLMASATGLIIVEPIGPQLGWIMLAAGLILIAGVLRQLITKMPQPRYIFPLLLTQFSIVILDTSRLYLCLLAMGANVSWLQCLVISLGSVLAAAIMVVPSGLGVSEVGAAALSLLVGVPPASAYLATALNRLSGLFVTTIAALLIMYYTRRARHNVQQ